MLTDPGLAARILRDDAFAGHSYDLMPLTRRFDVRLDHLAALSRHFPLAFEGDEHRALRRKFSAVIAASTAAGLAAFDETLRAGIADQLVEGREPCLMRDLLAPAASASVFALAGIGGSVPPGIMAVPLLFDDTISVGRRVRIEETVARLFEALGPAMAEEERYFRIAMVALSANTLLGSLGMSMRHILERNPGIPLSAVVWDADFPVTGLPLIEKRVTRDIELKQHLLREGQRVRIFLDAAGFAAGSGPVFSDLYFGAGPHKCPGMGFSRAIWRLLVARLREIPLVLRLQSAELRKADSVFNFPERLEVVVHG